MEFRLYLSLTHPAPSSALLHGLSTAVVNDKVLLAELKEDKLHVGGKIWSK